VIEMTNSTSISGLGSEFDAFLFSPIGADRNDTPLSVLSVLARLDIDPWQEAGELARLPRDAATQRLASSIAALPDGPSAPHEHGIIAARLIALLPRQSNSKTPSLESLPNVDDVAKFRTGVYMYVVLIVVMLAAQWIVTGGQMRGPIDRADASASSAVVPQTPAPNSDP